MLKELIGLFFPYKTIKIISAVAPGTISLLDKYYGEFVLKENPFNGKRKYEARGNLVFKANHRASPQYIRQVIPWLNEKLN